ncbi:ATP-dependent helicase HrpA [Saccharopolyspora erythraea NRRL 2338]|uniref:RNA helicase n=2 Tax=Saccharopolyspora erythraea TaxID=1836 RepID=A4FMV1_SACEN|nr:ATP-dependent RNA helicase HrpA [Saccharopolyspora erythraea]EQD84413.1 RNA helicase [Saccharopolyspora erythraea D]PFG99019.1 ATP-dependent helicase HrpA [Saccharopolyspora erythraea NRRL 2338]QRK88987.1 ATP-dependent RNA helicase HrpA [Saccharopolyspora erythraea]CAM05376.1 ATP-dependent helicase [Saccharopolyspora erythraea NRRL 2338]
MGTSSVERPLGALRERLPDLMLHDQRRLRRRIEGARKIRDAQALEPVVAEISADLAAAEQRVQQRRGAVPEIRYPQELPVSRRREDLLAAIRDNQVVIVAGETGSGKTTQIPKMCLELGRGVQGMIGHTQPRRLAARTVAERVAEELGTELGEAIGYQVRFTDRAGSNTLVKLMTDGILLAEIQQDRLLRRYDTLIIDEAHERSLNIDFILGYLKQLLPRRPDLKVIITSATIDPERFSRHFDDAPVVEVSGRTYPVEVRYRPLVDDSADEEDVERDQVQAICDAVDELGAEGPGDVLVFLSGEREIRDTAEALQQQNLRNTEILPLYARLSAAEQHRVFQPHAGRRIVLATNVAETSLTVPGIKYVIDPGTARISRYSFRTKVQRLPIEPVSQASANQRKGRCGRVSEGICIRLYSEQDFESRPEFTDPEILRTNLASVILQMTSLGLGDIASFPFIEPPDRRQVTDGVNLLHELGAIDPAQKDVHKRLTSTGRKLAQLPVDPRLARMVLEAERNGCVRETLVIAAALSIQDPRERPADKQQAAGEKHARFADKESDFLSYLNLWQYLREQQRELSGNQFRKLCKAEFLNYLRVREWQDLYAQLRQMTKSMGITPNSHPADPAHIHQSLLAGLLSHIGLKDTDKKQGPQNRGGGNEYLGARNAKFAVFPGSALFKKPPRWVMAAELVETSRLWARIAARVEPEWIEKLAQHLVKRSYSEPHWEKDRAAVMAYEKVTLYGVPLVAGRKVQYGRIEPELSRELFIRHALVEGDWNTRHEFFHANRALLEEVEDLEERARRRDILVDDQTLFDFYDQRVGAEVVSGAHFDSWWKKTRREQPDLLNFEKSMLINQESAAVSDRDYPDAWQQGGHRLPLSYQFEPGADADGVTVHIPLQVLNQIDPDGFDRQIPGMREELVTALIKSLPKQLRRNFVPVPDHARAALARMEPGGDLLESLEQELRRMTGVTVPRESWDFDRIPDHLRMTFRVVDGKGRKLAESKDLGALKQRLKPKVRAEISKAADEVEKSGLREWDFGELPRTFQTQRSGHAVKAYPALVDEGESVAVRIFDTEEEQREAHWRGTRRLLLLNLPSPLKSIQRGMGGATRLVFGASPHGDVAGVLDDCLKCAVDKLIADHGGPVWDQASFATLLGRVGSQLGSATADTVSKVERVLTARQQVDALLADRTRRLPAESMADITDQLSGLLHPGFVTGTGWTRLLDVVRYLKAVEQRVDKLQFHPQRDQDWMYQVFEVQDRYRDMLDAVPAGRPVPEELRQVGWMIEELRVSLFAQTLGTPHPVSLKRVHRAMDKAQKKS